MKLVILDFGADNIFLWLYFSRSRESDQVKTSLIDRDGRNFWREETQQGINQRKQEALRALREFCN